MTDRLKLMDFRMSIEPIEFHHNYGFASTVVDAGGGKFVGLARLSLTSNFLVESAKIFILLCDFH